ncbi:MAG TPA: family 43 glycosylhydrolase [Roseiflexaceae bacterium]|nr:family 43 glycosylhydrolase [Roseiflexaceae bacterium]
MQRRMLSRLPHLLFALLLLAMSAIMATDASARAAGTYRNPLNMDAPNVGSGAVESCADPTVIKGQTPGDNYWYLYCTKDPLNDQDRAPGGDFNFHNISMHRSLDLVHWTYMGDAFSTVPSWGEATSGMWAPEVDYFNGKYYLYYTMTDVKPATSGVANCDSDSAIGVATSASPTGPWTDHGSPVVAPRQNGSGCNFFWTYDPDVIVAQDGQKYIYYGSYYGGIQARPLSADGFSTTAATAVQVTIPNRYEGTEVVFHDGYYYLFGSAANCCNGPLTGYSIFAGRSTSPTGPFVDKQGVSLLAGRVGGTPVISMNGNRWVGPGHNTVFKDFDGQWWTIYHAIDQNDPYFADPNPGRINKRPALLDALDWIDGWPTVRGGQWASDTPQAAPAAQPGDKTTYKPRAPQPDESGQQIAALSDEFNGTTFSQQWSWVRQPATTVYSVTNGTFGFNTQAADLYVDSNDASVLTEPTPNGNYVVEAKVKLNLPPEGCCYNYVQAGLVIYGGDDAFIKLTHVSIWETRQTEFAREVPPPVPAGYPRYGNTVVGPPGEWTWLRIVKENKAGKEHYTAYTSNNGTFWVRGGTWTHDLGSGARIGLVSMGGSGFTANFDYVRVYHLHH